MQVQGVHGGGTAGDVELKRREAPSTSRTDLLLLGSLEFTLVLLPFARSLNPRLQILRP